MNKATRGTLSAMPELRSYPAQFEVRNVGTNSVELTGYASTTEQPYTMYDMFGDYSEVVRAGAFAKTIAEGADVSFLANHGGLSLARTRANSLVLEEDTTGLLSRATLNTARGDARDLVTAIEDGTIDEMSFAFRVVRQQWSPDYDERALIELNLDRGDVSAVNYGANPNTSIGASRAFRSVGPAKLARLSAQVRAGTLAPADAATVAHALDLVAAADSAVDKVQPLLAELIGVPNPDADDYAERSQGYLDTLRLIELERYRV